MEDSTLKITSVLADPTRYSIYQHIYSLHRGVTVQEIAEAFSIHPNVARLHLTKLEDVSLLTSRSDKSGKGGRPSRIYELSEEVVNIQFPPRDYQLLSEIAIRSLVSLGKVGEEAIRITGHQMGKEISNEEIRRNFINVKAEAFDQLIEYVKRIAGRQGVNPEIIKVDESTLRFRLYNCTFKEVAEHHPLVCKMHHNFLTGVLESFFGNITLVEENSIFNGCSACSYTMVRLS